MTTMHAVESFLSGRRIALIGLSRNPQHFSHAVFRELAARGYEVLPVHPTATTLEDRPAWRSVAQIPGVVDGALVMTPAEASADAVRDALGAGVRRIWLYRAAGPGAVSEEALRLCEEAQAEVVPGECPLMFLRDAAWYHRLHGWGRRVAGGWPSESPSA